MSEGKIKVAVSPFYQGFGWRDVALNKDFKPQPRLIPIVISNDEDLSEVVRRVRLNHLVLLEGALPEVGQPEDKDKLIESQEAEITALKSTNQTLESAKQTLESEKKTLQSENQDLESENTALKQEIEELKAAIPEEEEPVEEELYTQEELEALKVTDLKEILDQRETEYSPGARKDELIELLVGQIK